MKTPSYEDLQLAHRLISSGQRRIYWEQHPIPICPIGKVFLEPIRQILTFLFPIALLVGVPYHTSLHMIVATIPVALLVGYLLDLQVSWSIKKKRARECNQDRGRYSIVRRLSFTLDIAPEKITLDMVEKMAHEFQVVSAQRINQEKERLRSQGRKSTTQSLVDDEQLSAPAINRTWAAAGTGVAASYLSEAEEPSNQYWEPSFEAVNSASGLTMMGGNTFGVDVEGNTFGSGF